MSQKSSSCFFSLPPEQFTILSTIIGIAIVQTLDLDQQNALGNFIVNVGQAILTAAAQGQSLQTDNDNDRIAQQLQCLKKQICVLEKEIGRG